MPKTTLLKALMQAGTGSRRQVAAGIIGGKVRVNDKTVDNLKHPVDTAKDTVDFDGKPVDLNRQELICLMLNKPTGVLSTTRDERGRRTVIDLLPEEYRNMKLYPAGRLDIDTTGLLLLTNDGDLTYRLTHPSFEHEKEYLVHIDKELTAKAKNSLEKGILLDDGKTSPAEVKEIKSSTPSAYSLTIHEGRKRQVRRMFESLGHKVIDLKRIRIGGLKLGSLEEGKVRKLTAAEINKLRNR